MVLPEYDLSGRVALVTGAGRGIGKAIVLTLAEAGADIAAVARTPEQLDETAEEVRRLGRKCLTIPTDVTRREQVKSMAEKSLAEFGQIDILVNNAGAYIFKPLVPLPEYRPQKVEHIPGFFAPISDEELHRIIDTNLVGVILCTQEIGPHLLERRKGKVINISSVGAGKARSLETIYCTSKAAVSMFTRTLALEWARYHINVNAIAPGHFHTTISARLHEDPELRERMLRQIPMRRTGELREIGLLAVYLASEASNYMTGQTLYLEGGETV